MSAPMRASLRATLLESSLARALYSFEPLSGPYHRLKKWADAATKPEIEPLGRPGPRARLGGNARTPRTLTALLPLSATELSHSLYPQTRYQRNERIRMETLDSFLEKGTVELEPEILLKLDIQGYQIGSCVARQRS